MKPFFIEISNFWALADNLVILGIFGLFIRAHLWLSNAMYFRTSTTYCCVFLKFPFPFFFSHYKKQGFDLRKGFRFTFKLPFCNDTSYYVSTLSDPPTHHVSKHKHFARPTHPLFCLRNI